MEKSFYGFGFGMGMGGAFFAPVICIGYEKNFYGKWFILQVLFFNFFYCLYFCLSNNI